MDLLAPSAAAPSSRSTSSSNHPKANTKTTKTVMATVTNVRPLSNLCRACISTNVERFPPEALGILDEHEWDHIVKTRHDDTTPQKGTGGLDGTGRLHPAMSEKFLLEVEENNPHLRQSTVADELLWKDIVEYKFRKGGLSRPKALMQPWPVLVQKLTDAGQALNACLLSENWRTGKSEGLRHDVTVAAIEGTLTLQESAMNLALLKDSGIGKTVKKFLKKASRDNHVMRFLVAERRLNNDQLTSNDNLCTKLEASLQKWMDMASQNGVKMDKDDKDSKVVGFKTAPCAKDNPLNQDEHLLSIARQCHSWRELYEQLKIYNESRRSKQGEKMRARRDRLNAERPKIIKVRMKKHSLEEKRMVATTSGVASASKGTSKMQKLRMEASVTSMRQRLPTSTVRGSGGGIDARSKSQGSFGAAVANAVTRNPQGLKRKAPPVSAGTKTVALAGGKRMKVPDAKKTASTAMQKRLKMLKKGNATFR